MKARSRLLLVDRLDVGVLDGCSASFDGTFALKGCDVAARNHVASMYHPLPMIGNERKVWWCPN